MALGLCVVNSATDDRWTRQMLMVNRLYIFFNPLALEMDI